MSVSGAPTGITVAVGAEANRAQALAATLANALDLSVTLVHVELTTSAADDDHTPQETLAAAIAQQVPHDHLLIIESEHADRWRSRHSVAEHLIDAHQSATIALGPASHPTIGAGPIVVALDGSARARKALSSAVRLGAAIDRGLVLLGVVPEALGGAPSAMPAAIAALEKDAASIDAPVVVIESNDPVSALVAVCGDRQASFIALASGGDRQSARTTMSRTAAGLIAEAPCPVFVVQSA